DLLVGAGDYVLARDPATGLGTGATLDGLEESFAYDDEFGELAAIAAAHGGTLYEASFVRDALGRITSRTEAVGGDAATSWTYIYDDADRLTGAAAGTYVEAYTYDSVGNRLTDAFGRTYGYDAQNRLTSVTGGVTTTFTYTPQGEVATRTEGGATTAYSYDALGRLVGVSLPDGSE